MRKEEANKSFDEAERMSEDDYSPKGIVKEGLSEYFMFSIEGTETVKHGWSRRMRAVEAEDVDFDIVYRMRAHQYGERPVRFFIWNNDAGHQLGESPLPNGLVRIFRENGEDGLSYLGEQSVNYVPIASEIEINLGPDDLVVYETRKLSTKRFNFSFNEYSQVTGWEEEQSWVNVVKNYHDKEIVFELRQVLNGDVVYRSKQNVTLFDYRTTQTTFNVKSRGKIEDPYTVNLQIGTNLKQNRIELK